MDFAPFEDDIELDLYLNYTGKINDTFAWTAGATWYDYPTGDDLDGYWEAYVGFNAGAFSMKQWFADDFYAAGESAMYTEANYTAPLTDSVALVLHAGYSWGDFWDNNYKSSIDYAVQVQLDRRSLHGLRQGHGHRRQSVQGRRRCRQQRDALPRGCHDDVPLEQLKQSSREQDQRSTLA